MYIAVEAPSCLCRMHPIFQKSDHMALGSSNLITNGGRLAMAEGNGGRVSHYLYSILYNGQRSQSCDPNPRSFAIVTS